MRGWILSWCVRPCRSLKRSIPGAARSPAEAPAKAGRIQRSSREDPGVESAAFLARVIHEARDATEEDGEEIKQVRDRAAFRIPGRFLVEPRLSRSRSEAEGVLEDTSRPRDEELGKLGRPERAPCE